MYVESLERIKYQIKTNVKLKYLFDYMTYLYLSNFGLFLYLVHVIIISIASLQNSLL